ncbi:shTK domain protein [Dictyocaulus viviparus]|uniref:ShTK domain protein n=1 Tax=Dictyocaulus viviparus TaxID=29172 RepID=A0A0D8X7S4_DICVI|nr:shTK domain protein [Dictyocaulus viviparus]
MVTVSTVLASTLNITDPSQAPFSQTVLPTPCPTSDPLLRSTSTIESPTTSTTSTTEIPLPTRKPTRPKTTCRDRYRFYCRRLAASGFCTSPEYDENEKREKCPATCGFCNNS